MGSSQRVLDLIVKRSQGQCGASAEYRNVCLRDSHSAEVRRYCSGSKVIEL